MNILEIAKLAGVSKSTVSRYLNEGYVSEKNREKIKKVIDETGFQPLRYAKILRTQKTNLIGVILPKISTETSSRVVEGIMDELKKYNYDVLLATTNLSVEKEIDYLKLFKKGQVDGVIFMATKLSEEHRSVMDELKVPVVVVAQHMEGYPCVYHDDYNSAKEMVQLLINKGHKKIGFIGVEEEDISVGYERKRGYMDSLKENNIHICDELIKIGDFSSESAYKSIKELMEQDNKPTAIFAVTDTLAIGAMEYLNEKNKRIPDDVAICSIGDNKISRVVTPKLTTMHYFYKTSGIESAKIMMDLIKDNIVSSKEINKVVKLGYRLEKRNSV